MGRTTRAPVGAAVGDRGETSPSQGSQSWTTYPTSAAGPPRPWGGDGSAFGLAPPERMLGRHQGCQPACGIPDYGGCHKHGFHLGG